jgi:hypothetical protein
MSEQIGGNSVRSAQLVNEDQEAWVTARIKSAINLAIGLRAANRPRAEHDMIERAVDALVDGCAVEIIRTLGMEPKFVNIRQRYSSGDINAVLGAMARPQGEKTGL